MQGAIYLEICPCILRSRYPDYAKDLSTVTTRERAKDTLEKTKEAYQWLLTMEP
jgi:hypothetical protein